MVSMTRNNGSNGTTPHIRELVTKRIYEGDVGFTLVNDNEWCTRLVNVYDNWIREESEEEQIGRRNTGKNQRRSIEEVDWTKFMTRRTVIAGDFNAHSQLWNQHCTRRVNAEKLETLIDKYDLIVANDGHSPTYTGVQTRSISIIDLILHSADVNITTWAIDEEHATHSDHEVVTWEAEEDKNWVYPSTMEEHNGWSISKLLNDEERRDQAAAMWRHIASLRGNLEEKRAQNNAGATISKEEIEEEATWIQETITEVMNDHARKLRITARSKRWWKPEISEARKKLSQAKRGYGDSQREPTSASQANQKVKKGNMA
ncbi:hypothetical protein EX30DRAFT_352760 [Ascodesmis nigricans]|uniref:Endonuclease/exonuclease/phosphatase domain-containing protein n=1 Tax=Ascodesmis nigricans TaxID=341454 RepID=A0A4S2MP48_9PEZI|nr:hypothetical protein EX30DRAFT_352760 [Ascodesmis nigricans]